MGRGLGALIGPAPVKPVLQARTEDEVVAATRPQEDTPPAGADSRTLPASPGRGGGSQASSEYDAEGTSVRFVSPSDIVENVEQPREYFAEEPLDELADSIREHGLLQPLVVTERADGSYELIAGERRLRASRRVGLKTVPVIVRPKSDNQDKLVLALIENIQRQDLNAVEEGRGYKRLAEEYGLSHEEIARRMGKSRSAVSNAMRLLDLDRDMLQALEEGKISKSHARTLLAEPVPKLRRDLFTKMLGGGVTVRSAEAQAGARARSSSRLKDANIAALEAALRDALGTKVVVEYRGGSGKVVIHFYSKDDLRKLTAQISGEETEI